MTSWQHTVQTNGKLKPRNLVIPQIDFPQISTTGRGHKALHRVKISRKYIDWILRKTGSKFKISPQYLRNGGHLGVKIFIHNRGPRGLITEPLGSGSFLRGARYKGSNISHTLNFSPRLWGVGGRIVARWNRLAELNKMHFTECSYPFPNPRYHGFNFVLDIHGERLEIKTTSLRSYHSYARTLSV